MYDHHDNSSFVLQIFQLVTIAAKSVIVVRSPTSLTVSAWVGAFAARSAAESCGAIVIEEYSESPTVKHFSRTDFCSLMS